MQKIKNLSEQNLRYILGFIRNTVKISDAIDDINYSTKTTVSSVRLKQLLDQLDADVRDYAESLVSALTHLTARVTDVQPTLENSDINVIYLYKDPSSTGEGYQQYLKLDETTLIDLGGTTVNLDNIYTKDDVDNTFETITNCDAIRSSIGTLNTLTTTAKDSVVNALNEINSKSDIETLTTAQYNTLVSTGSVVVDDRTITYSDDTYYVISDDSTSIDTTKFNIQTFTTPEQLGLSTGCTVEDIFLALPKNSIARITNDGNTIVNCPEKYGILMIDKQAPWRFDIEFKAIGGNVYTENRKYLGILKGDDGTGLTWEKVLVSKVSNVGKTAISFSSTYYTASGDTNWYMVKDGLATISLDVTVNQPYNPTSSTIYYHIENLPTPIADYGNSVSVWNADCGVTLSFIVDTDGKLLLLGGETGMDYRITFSYQVSES